MQSKFDSFIQQQVLPLISQFPLQYIKGQKGYQLAYRYIIQSNKPNTKLIILVNGRAENILKWSEIAFDYYQQGYDIVLFDHRGQGYSQRLLADSEKGYVDEFSCYVQDLRLIVNHCSTQHNYKNIHLLAHSLGALISSYYLAHYEHPIQRAVFSSPFFSLPLKSPLRDEILINLMRALGQGKQYVFGKSAYKPVDIKNNLLSSSQDRMAWMNHINQSYPKIRLGGPTFHWVSLCQQACKKLPEQLTKINIPVLILQAEQEKIVSNKNIEKLTALLPQRTKIIIPQAKHEILFENDVIRQQALQYIFNFFNH